jgi:hypothetical protein
MNVFLWILAGLLALAFLAAGGGKPAQPKEKLAASPNMAWTEDFSPGVIKMIGALEVLAAIGLILPAALDIVPVLVPLALDDWSDRRPPGGAGATTENSRAGRECGWRSGRAWPDPWG